MKLTIVKKGVVDCTSDSRSHHIDTLRDGIEGAIKIVDQEVLELRYARFCVNDSCKLEEYKKDGNIEVKEKDVCLKLLNYFKEHPEELQEDYEYLIHIHVSVWEFFNDGDNCSDYIEIYDNILEVSCQDEYDPDSRDEFHDSIEELLGSDYAVVSDDGKLLSLHICVTEKCSAGCDTCYVNREVGRELEREDWDKLPLAEQYAIGGGEPAEYPLMVELVDYLKNERKGYVAVTTNGQKIINFNTLPDKIAISIDGLVKKKHELTHNTDLSIAKSIAKYYKDKGVKVCINSIVNKANIDDAEKFAEFWTKKGYEVNFILFTGEDRNNNLRPTYEQLDIFRKYFGKKRVNRENEGMMIDSCMGGLLTLIGDSSYRCPQGLFSKYYKYGTILPCSHSAFPYPICKVIEEYLIHFFKTLRPMVFVYYKDGTSGAHEWAFSVGLKGKVLHKVDNQLRKDTIYILTDDEEKVIKEPHYVAYFKDKIPFWIESKKLNKYNRIE